MLSSTLCCPHRPAVTSTNVWNDLVLGSNNLQRKLSTHSPTHGHDLSPNGASCESPGHRPGDFYPASWFRIGVYCSRGSLTPVAAPNVF